MLCVQYEEREAHYTFTDIPMPYVYPTDFTARSVYA